MKLPFALVLGLVLSVQAGIDYEQCEEPLGTGGETTSCSEGYVLVGLCIAGNVPCNGAYAWLRCCAETEDIARKGERACTEVDGGPGERVECPEGTVVTEVCSSGGNIDAGQRCPDDVETRLTCCDEHSLILNEDCSWITGGGGMGLGVCPVGSVAAGGCTGDTGPACGGRWNELYCCGFDN